MKAKQKTLPSLGKGARVSDSAETSAAKVRAELGSAQRDKRCAQKREHQAAGACERAADAVKIAEAELERALVAIATASDAAAQVLATRLRDGPAAAASLEDGAANSNLSAAEAAHRTALAALFQLEKERGLAAKTLAAARGEVERAVVALLRLAGDRIADELESAQKRTHELRLRLRGLNWLGTQHRGGLLSERAGGILMYPLPEPQHVVSFDPVRAAAAEWEAFRDALRTQCASGRFRHLTTII
jgi:hypothetical protein